MKKEPVALTREKSVTLRVLVGKLEGKKPVERPGCGREVNIEMDLKIIG